MTDPTCAHCTDRPVNGTTICAPCTKTLDVAIANIRSYAVDLDTIRTRQARYTAVAGKTSAPRETPLPVDNRFLDSAGIGADLAWVTRNTIVGWTRVALEHWPPPPRLLLCDDLLCRRCQPLAAEARLRQHPRDNLVSCCHYLQRLLPRIAAAEWAEQMLDELLDLERRLRRFVDRPPDRWYAGPCTAGLHALEGTWFCGAELYANPEHATVTCPDCAWVYSVEERRAWLLAAAEDRLENAATIARAVLVLGQADGTETQLAGRIRQWARRRRIVARANRQIEGKPQPLYRVGDVLDLLAEDARHAVERAV